MKPQLLCIQSHYGKPSKLFREAGKRHDTTLVRQAELTREHLLGATGLITTMHLDQLGMLAFSTELELFLNRGGRWFFNGHMMRALVFGLKTYEYVDENGKAALALTELAEHVIFAGVDRADLGARKGVAGFYGRGSNPMPEGAVAITGVGRKQAPLDWDWTLAGGGRLFSHAGNDLQSTAGPDEAALQLSQNIIAWALTEDLT